MLKIAFLHYTFPTGGAEKVTQLIAKGLEKSIYCELFMFAAEIKQTGITEDMPGFKYFLLPDKNIYKTNNRDFIVSHLNDYRIDILIVPVIPLPYFGSIKAGATHCKVVYAHHSLPFYDAIQKISTYEKNAQKSIGKYMEWHLLRKPKYKFFTNLKSKFIKQYKEIYDNVDAFTVLCDNYGKEFAKEFNVDYKKSKIVTLTNPATFTSSQNSHKKKQVLFVGRLTYADKRVDRLLKIWRLLENDFPDWELLIVGDGDEKSNLEALKNKLKLNHVKFCGYTPDPSTYYHEAAIMCLTSRFEGWPMCIVEAQISGVATIAFDCSGGVKELVSPNGVNGVLIKPFEIKLYAKELSNLMRDDALRNTIAQNASQNIKQYSIDNSISQWTTMINNLGLETEWIKS